MHTSSVSVAVLDNDSYTNVELFNHELKKEYTRGSGPGGQHRNKTESCVTVIHIPTGISARIDGRHKHKNEAEALRMLTERVNEYYRTGFVNDVVDERREQIGNSDGDDARRIYKVKTGIVTDNITGKSVRLKDVLRGKIENLK